MKNSKKNISNITSQDINIWKDFAKSLFKSDYQLHNFNLDLFKTTYNFDDLNGKKLAEFYAGNNKTIKNQTFELINACYYRTEKYNERKAREFAHNLSQKIIKFVNNKPEKKDLKFLPLYCELLVLQAELIQQKTTEYLLIEEKLNRYYEFEKRLEKTEDNDLVYKASSEYLQEAEKYYTSYILSKEFLAPNIGGHKLMLDYKLDLYAARVYLYEDKHAEALKRYTYSLKAITAMKKNKDNIEVMLMDYDEIYIYQEVALCCKILKRYDNALYYIKRSFELDLELKKYKHEIAFSPIIYSVKLFAEIINETISAKEIKDAYKDILLLYKKISEIENELPAEFKRNYPEILHKILDRANEEFQNTEPNYFNEWNDFVSNLPTESSNSGAPQMHIEDKVNSLSYFLTILMPIGDKYNIQFRDNVKQGAQNYNDDDNLESFAKKVFIDFIQEIKEKMSHRQFPSHEIFDFKSFDKAESQTKKLWTDIITPRSVAESILTK